MNLSTIATLIGMGGAVVGGYVFMDDRHVHKAEYEQAVEAQTNYFIQSEKRSLRREIRQLEAIQDERGLTPREKDYKRELEDQLEDIK